MKKFMRIALVFALAGAALVGCTKDYSGDISDLNKEVSAIQSTLTSLQTSIQGAQSAADAAAATANTALSAAKAAATADDLKAVQTALAAAATSADLTAVDAKYAAYIPEIEAAAKASDLEALETALAEAIANTNVSIENLKAALATKADKADLDAAAEKILALETNYIALEARVAALEAALAKLDTIEAALADKANKADVDSALAELQAKIDELLAQGDGAFSIKSVSNQANKVNYFWAKWKPGNTKAEKEYFAKLAEEFPELKEIEKGDVVASCTNVPFIVTPATLEFDETDSFSLVDINGEDFGWELGEPFASPANVKAGTAGVWFAKVLAPAYNTNGTIKNSQSEQLALFVERADGSVAQTSFDYTVKSEEKPSATTITYHVTVNDNPKAGDFEDNAYDLNLKDVLTAPTTVYDNYYIIEPTSKVQVEKYGVSVDGKTLTVENLPKAGESIELTFTKTAIMLDGRTAQSKPFTVTINGDAISANAELDDQTVTLGWAQATGYNVTVDYAVADFGFSALEWETVFKALEAATTPLSAERDDETFSDYTETRKLGTYGNIVFLNKNKKSFTSAYSSEDVAYIRFVIDSKDATPGEYSVKITDGKVFCAVGNVTVKNPAAKPVKIAEKLCEDGVLLVVGDTPADGFITYDLTNALVTTDHLGGTVKTTAFDGYKFKDVAFEAATEETADQTVEENWIATSDEKTFKVPTWGGQWGNGYSHNNKKAQKLLNTVREFAVYFNWFKDGEQNIDSLHFTAKAVSPIWTKDGANITVKTTDEDGNVLVNTTIYYQENEDAEEYKSTDLNAAEFSGKYVAGNNSGNAFDVTNSGVTEVKFEWKTVEKEKDAFPAYDQPDFIKVTNTINNSNVIINTTTTSVTLVVDGNNRPIVVPLETVLDAGEIDYATYANWKEIGFTVYLTKDYWCKIYNEIWQKYWCPMYKYDGQYIPWNGTNYILGGYDASKESEVKDAIKAVNKKINDLASSSNAVERQEYAKYKYFVEQLGVIKFSTKLNKENCWTANAYVEGKPVTLKPDELAMLPYFTCKNAENYTKYVTFNGMAEGKAPKATDHITTISTYGNDAGKSTVEIPLTLNVVDKWGMTTEKEFKITVKVK